MIDDTLFWMAFGYLGAGAFVVVGAWGLCRFISIVCKG